MPRLAVVWARKPLGSLRPWSGVQMWVSPFVSGVPNHTRVFDSTVTFRLLFRSLLPAIRSPICRSPKSIFIASTSDCRQPLAVSRRRSVAPSSFFVFSPSRGPSLLAGARCSSTCRISPGRFARLTPRCWVRPSCGTRSRYHPPPLRDRYTSSASSALLATWPLVIEWSRMNGAG